MKKLIENIKTRMFTEYSIDLGVIILFSLVTIVFLVSFFKIYF